MKGTSGEQDSYYFEFSLNRVFVQEIANRMGVPSTLDITATAGQDGAMELDYSKYGMIMVNVLFPKEFQFWRENLAEVYWGINSLDKIKE